MSSCNRSRENLGPGHRRQACAVAPDLRNQVLLRAAQILAMSLSKRLRTELKAMSLSDALAVLHAMSYWSGETRIARALADVLRKGDLRLAVPSALGLAGCRDVWALRTLRAVLRRSDRQERWVAAADALALRSIPASERFKVRADVARRLRSSSELTPFTRNHLRELWSL